MPNPDSWFWSAWLNAVPPLPVKSVCEWARRHVKLVGSARSEAYDPDITPWTKEPIESIREGVRKATFVKPIQCGGSVVGLIALLWHIVNGSGGDAQYNWPSMLKAQDKWDKVIEKTLLACAEFVRKAGKNFKWKDGLVILPHLNLTVQGVRTDSSVTSDSIAFQINEELHDEEGGWFPGRLEQAYGRTTAFWNSTIFNISNAGKVGGQLHQAFLSGTQQHWEVQCPGCGMFHRMRTRWEDEHPELGGLWYDGSIKTETGDYDYNRIAPTVHFRMPCGYMVHEDVQERRQLSLSGKYSAPVEGSNLLERSWTLEAVSVDYIPWLDLIKQKHKARRAYAYGDSEPWFAYLRERECQFSSDENRPTTHKIIVSTKPKDRAGLTNRIARLGSGDYQQGTAAAGELPHWWHLICDVAPLPNGGVHVLVVSEGKCLTDADLIDAFNRHEVKPTAVVLDSGYSAPHVYALCMANGYNAIKGEDNATFAGHEDGGRKIFEPVRPLHAMVPMNPKYPYQMILTRSPSGVKSMEHVPDANEPQYWRYSKGGIADRFAWMQSTPMVKLEIPADVSKDFLSHMDSESYQERKHPRTGETVGEWIQHKTRNDLLVCFRYIGMLILMAGLFGSDAEPEKKTK
jgi:hypothetical protein